MEQWLPFLTPRDVHVIASGADALPRGAPPPAVVVTSYNMLRLAQARVQ